MSLILSTARTLQLLPINAPPLAFLHTPLTPPNTTTVTFRPLPPTPLTSTSTSSIPPPNDVHHIHQHHSRATSTPPPSSQPPHLLHHHRCHNDPQGGQPAFTLLQCVLGGKPLDEQHYCITARITLFFSGELDCLGLFDVALESLNSEVFHGDCNYGTTIILIQKI
ncbi:hypothetical protein Tco_1429444 [Tanacetum coccineum]